VTWADLLTSPESGSTAGSFLSGRGDAGNDGSVVVFAVPNELCTEAVCVTEHHAVVDVFAADMAIAATAKKENHPALTNLGKACIGAAMTCKIPITAGAALQFVRDGENLKIFSPIWGSGHAVKLSIGLILMETTSLAIVVGQPQPNNTLIVAV
jgi:hypothetical protein